jgi:hypothetical protein
MTTDLPDKVTIASLAVRHHAYIHSFFGYSSSELFPRPSQGSQEEPITDPIKGLPRALCQLKSRFALFIAIAPWDMMLIIIHGHLWGLLWLSTAFVLPHTTPIILHVTNKSQCGVPQQKCASSTSGQGCLVRYRIPRTMLWMSSFFDSCFIAFFLASLHLQ